MYSNDYYAMFGGVIFVILLIVLAIAIYSLVVLFKLFEKAGEKGWKAIIPFYSYIVLSNLATGGPALGIALAIIKFLQGLMRFAEIDSAGSMFSLASAILSFIVFYRFAKSFGCESGRSVCAGLFGGIALGKPAFDKSGQYEYYGPDGTGGNFSSRVYGYDAMMNNGYGYGNNQGYGNDGYGNNQAYGNGNYNQGYGNGGYNNNQAYGSGAYNNNQAYGNGGYNNNQGYGNGAYNNNPAYGSGGYNNNQAYGNGSYGNNQNYSPNGIPVNNYGQSYPQNISSSNNFMQDAIPSNNYNRQNYMQDAAPSGSYNRQNYMQDAAPSGGYNRQDYMQDAAPSGSYGNQNYAQDNASYNSYNRQNYMQDSSDTGKVSLDKNPNDFNVIH